MVEPPTGPCPATLRTIDGSRVCVPTHHYRMAQPQFVLYGYDHIPDQRPQPGRVPPAQIGKADDAGGAIDLDLEEPLVGPGFT